MGAVIGDILPLAVGITISPVPIIAAILMLLSPKAKGTSVGFLIGWLAGIVIATTVFVVIAATAGLDDASSSPSTTSSWIKIVLGLLLLLLTIKQWRGRPKPGEKATLPKWMAAIDSFTFAKALALGFLLSAVNPKNLLMCVGAGTAIGGGDVDTGQMILAVAIFTVIGGCSVAIPVVGYLVAHDKMSKPLDELRVWLQDHNAAVMSVLLLVIGVVLIGKGIGGL